MGSGVNPFTEISDIRERGQVYNDTGVVSVGIWRLEDLCLNLAERLVGGKGNWLDSLAWMAEMLEAEVSDWWRGQFGNDTTLETNKNAAFKPKNHRSEKTEMK